MDESSSTSNKDDGGDLYEAALGYASEGWLIFPAAIGVEDWKSPDHGALRELGFSSWEEISQAFSADEVAKVWGNGVARNIAWIPSNGLAAFDFDVKSKRLVSYTLLGVGLEKLEQATRLAETGRGFRIFCKLEKPRNINVEDVELRADRQYSLIPPSRHKSGSIYRWVNPRVRDIITINDEQLKTIELRMDAWKQYSAFAKRLVNAWRPEHRHRLALWLGSYCRHSGLDLEFVQTLVEVISLKAGDNEVEDRVRAIVDAYTVNESKLASPSKLKTELNQVVGGAEAKRTLELWPESIEKEPAQVATKILETYHIVTLADTDEILHYNDGLHHTGGEAVTAKDVEDQFRAAAKDEISSNHFVKEVQGHIRRRTYRKREEFDSDPFILNLKNGLLDVRTFELKPHTPEYLSLVQLPVTYNASATCPKTLKFLREVLFPEDLALVQELSGYLLWRENPAHVLVILYGVGANGKTTLITVWQALLGEDNICARSLQDLETNRFAPADLFGRLCNIYDDLPDQALKTAGRIKLLSGAGFVTAERKNQQPFNFKPFAKHIFSCNSMPEIFDDTTAFWRRLVVLVFPRIFLGKDDNRNLKHELTSKEELSGFLNWALEGLKRLQANGWKFSYSRSIDEVRIDYKRKSSPIEAFVMDCCKTEVEAVTPKKELYEAFTKYCEANKMVPVTYDSFFQRLPIHAPHIEKTRPIIHGKLTYCIQGLNVRGKEDWGKKEDEEGGGQQTLD